MNLIRTAARLVMLLPLAALTGIPAAHAAPEAPAKPAKSSGFVFSLLPKSLQKNPRLDFNIITEVTPAGRKLTPATPQQPTYYVSQAGKQYTGGISPEQNLKGPSPEKLQQMMEKSLAENGYLVSDGAAHPATIAIIYQWGSHSFEPPPDIEAQDADGNAIATAATPEVALRKALLDRAMLLGGTKFATEVVKAMQQLDLKATMGRDLTPQEGRGDLVANMGDLVPDPFDQLRARSAEMDRLVSELFSSSFFVVATAYDCAAMAKSQRLMLWRTKMTVNSIGVNMLESVPPLIINAGPYYGRETTEPVVITKRVSREGKVEVGTARIVPDAAPSAKPAQPAPDSEKR